MSSSVKQWSIVLGVMAFLYAGLHPIQFATSRPHGDHAWAQCDRASVALNFHKHHYPIWMPHTHSIAFNDSGVAPGEFPLIPFLVAKLYGVLGFHEFIFRITTLLLSLTGFVFSLLIARQYLQKFWWQVAAATVWLFSPNLIYYSFGFLPDNVALSCFAVAFYFTSASTISGWTRMMLIALAASIAVLLKSSVALLVLSLMLSLTVSQYYKNKKVPTLRLLPLAISICIGVCWLLYARHLQELFHSPVFKLGLVPPQSVHDVYDCLRKFAALLPQLYPIPLLLLLAVAFVYVFKKFSLRNPLHVFTITSLAAWVFFSGVMMRNACHHGYYHVPFQFAVFTLLLCAFQLIEQKNYSLEKVRLIGVAALMLLVLIGHTHTLRKISSHHDLIHPAWNGAEATLRKCGIKPTDRVFTYPDVSYNLSLYLMNQRGWNCMKDVRASYKEQVLKQCSYAVLGDTGILQTPSLAGYFSDRLATYEGLSIYRIRH